ncbi:hypothetical protein P170DRAFT_490252 [Aspergillus steynii IBT 23096]|uniref:Small secreted protein n=1 Tax=Aspergillus steynii IBT 23096 TaxID=1392250 RepID=A0A2I2GK54_9EURO|nr:uncharacterized protein P170DRAFT_490252 [Aspergillus steynii IBT 23096]PLB53255.1 hypothetical protein P170DRAFT_490252 [Aspergillus steynii IBT 23096]
MNLKMALLAGVCGTIIAAANPVAKRGDAPPAETAPWAVLLFCDMVPDQNIQSIQQLADRGFFMATRNGSPLVNDGCDDNAGCRWNSPELAGGFIQAHPNPWDGKCEMYFTYNGQDFGMEDGSCGYYPDGIGEWEGEGRTAACYFNA